jgi:hypothetical protein
MGYESAPATEMVATSCAVCARPLCDAVSVEMGIGPECRKKHGFLEPVSEEARAEANKLVYLIAAKQTGPEVVTAVARLKVLGFARLSERIVRLRVVVTITEAEDRIVVKAPYTEASVEAFRGVYGRRWDKDQKANTFPRERKAELFAALQRAFPGALAEGPKGPFVIPGAA